MTKPTVSMPVIGMAEIALKKLSLDRQAAEDLQKYREAYAASYNVEVSIEEIVAGLVVAGMKGDKAFQTHLKTAKKSTNNDS